MRRIIGLGILAFLAIAFSHTGLPSVQPARAAEVDSKDWDAVVDKAVAYFQSSQAPDGSWSKKSNPGITGVVTYALLRSGKATAQTPAIAKALKTIEGMADPATGSLAGKDGKGRLQNYLTAVNLMAAVTADRKSYAKLSEQAVRFLKKLPFDEDHGKEPKDAYYGGVGYNTSTRPDLSNTTFFLEALRAAQVPADDPIYRKVLVYVSRSQDLKSEFNNQPWAGKINDGGFNYGAGPAGQKKDTQADSPRPAYGSITCSGLVSLMDCGVKREDLRYRKALEWIQKHYTVENNPGTGGDRGYYLYLRMLSEALSRAGIDSVTDGAMKAHDWRAEVTAALKSRQQKDGSWVNKIPAWQEGNPDLATAWALIALYHCKPRGN